MKALFTGSTLIGLAMMSAFAHAGDAYISLGDSLAFGYQPGDLTADLGIQGYVSTFANGYPGGFSKVINLGVAGETTSSFFTGGMIGEFLNQNYTFGVSTQAGLLQSDATALQAGGTTIKVVSLMLGANDLQDINTTGLSVSQAEALYSAANAASAVRIANIVASIVSLAPSATILINQYYNPYDILPANNPQRIEAEYGIDQLNANLASIAATYGAKTVDFGSVINGNIALYTHMADASPDVHLNDLGYQVGGQLMLQAVPEPSPVLMFAGLGLGALLVRRIRS